MQTDKHWIFAIYVMLILAFFIPLASLAGTWTSKSNMLRKKEDLKLAEVNGIIYAMGGNSSARQDVEAYDPVTNKWTRKANIPTPREEMGVSVVNGLIYCIGGQGGRGFHNEVEVYDPGTDTWTRGTDMPTARRICQSAAVNDIIYVIGGWIGSWLKTVEAYDPGTDTWTKKSDMLQIQGWDDVVVIDNKIYVTGWDSGGWDMQVYDPETDTWAFELRTDKWSKWSLTTCVLNDDIYIIGGTAGNPGVPEKPELVTPGHEIYAYNPMTKALKLEGYMEVPVAYADSIVVNGKIYVIGGWWHGKSVRDSVLEFNPLAAPPAHQTRDVDAKGKQTSIWGTLKTTE